MNTLEALRQHQLVILRRLRKGPLTEFELVREVANHSGHTQEQCEEKMAEWLDELRSEGLVWAGALTNANGQKMMAAALTRAAIDMIS